MDTVSGEVVISHGYPLGFHLELSMNLFICLLLLRVRVRVNVLARMEIIVE